MDENTTKLIKERFEALPESIQEVILSSDYENTLIEIGKQHQLNVEQMGVLERETTMTMMGLTPTKDFEIELIRELTMDKEKVSQIVKEIDEKVFLKIRDLLKLMNTPTGEEPNLGEEKNTDSPHPNPLLKVEGGTHDTPEEIKNNAQVFKDHGIEIIPEKLEIKGEVMPSILEQKLSSNVVVPTVKTEHTLPNLSQGNISTPNIPPTKRAVDPYREIPE